MTGHQTTGLYQTCTISCLLPERYILIPQRLFRLLRERGYDTNYCLVVRHPSIKPTNGVIFRIVEHPDPRHTSLVIPDETCIGYNADQDGDKLVVIPIVMQSAIVPDSQIPIWQTPLHAVCDFRDAFEVHCSRLEAGQAFNKSLTILGLPRFNMSETGIIVAQTHVRALIDSSRFMQRCWGKGRGFIDEARCGYMRADYELMRNNQLKNLILTATHDLLSVDDLIGATDTLLTYTCAKTSPAHITALQESLLTHKSLVDKRDEMIEQIHNYVNSSSSLSAKGRIQFQCLGAFGNAVIQLGNFKIGKLAIFSYVYYAGIGVFAINAASTQLLCEDIVAALS